jgi:hypothetical protein
MRRYIDKKHQMVFELLRWVRETAKSGGKTKVHRKNFIEDLFNLKTKYMVYAKYFPSSDTPCTHLSKAVKRIVGYSGLNLRVTSKDIFRYREFNYGMG